MAGLLGSEVLMLDGTVAVTEITSDKKRRDDCLSMLLQKMCEHGDMVVGIDIELPFSNGSHNLLTLGTKFGCLIIKLGSTTPTASIDGSSKLRRFLSHKDIIFAGVHIHQDVKRLWEWFSLEIRNLVDLSELAADVLHQPRLRSFGVRGLAHEVLLLPFKARDSSLMFNHSRARDPTEDQIQCASADAYAAYKIAKKLLGA